MKVTTGRIALTALNLLLASALALALFGVLRGGAQPAAERPAPHAEPRAEVEPRLPPHEQSERLIADLLERSDLIPFEGTLGGTMGFYTPDNVFILSDRWVYARFEDGHIGGEMLLEYRIDAADRIHWTVLSAEIH